MVGSFLKRLVRRLRSRRPNVNPFRSRYSRLTVEGLEQRLAPAAMTWTGGGGSTIFENPLNWSPIVGPGGGLIWQVPGPNDDATDNMTTQITITANETVHSLTVNANNVMIQGAGSLMAVNLTFSSPGGMFATSADITVSGAFNWTDGTFGGNGNLNLNGTSTFNESGGMPLVAFNRTINNAGTATWAQGNIQLNGANITNQVGATFVTQGGFSMTRVVGAETFTNNGTFKAANPGGPNLPTVITVPFNNVTPAPGLVPPATVEADGGTIVINSSAAQTQDGVQFSTFNMGTIQFQNGKHTLTDGTTFSGNISVNSGELNIPVGNVAYNYGGLQLTGTFTDLSGSGNREGTDGVFQNYGSFIWNQGTIKSLIFYNEGSMTLAGYSKYLDSSVIRNWGTMQWTQGNIEMQTTAGNCDLWNYGTFTIQANNFGIADSSAGGFTATIHNAIDPATGTRGYTIIQNNATTTINPKFINDADLNQGVTRGSGNLIIPNLVNNPGSTDVK